MAIYNERTGEMKVRIKGVDQHIRWMAGVRDDTIKAARRGVVEAANYLIDVIKEKIGRYQSTGGDGGGPWAKLKYETIARKLRKFGVGDKPLYASGDMKESFYVVEPRSNRAIAASVGSDDPKLIHHVYGAPRAGVPKRDPFLITAEEERDMCQMIIEDAIQDEYDRLGI